MSSNKEEKKEDNSAPSTAAVRRSISVRLIRHAESKNNQVYRDARYLFRGGTPEFDHVGWEKYVDTHRRSDPGLSDVGLAQQEKLAEYLVPHLLNQASRPVRVICSPMRRTLETIRPTLERIQAKAKDSTHIMVHGFYHESEGCHSNGIPEEGMNPAEIKDLYKACIGSNSDTIDFEGFPEPDRGWYVNGSGAETREQSEARASKFYLWLCEHLDQQFESNEDDVFDAGASVPQEVDECEHDKFAPRFRRRRMTLLVGHADFMSLVLKRVVSGFGHFVEHDGVSHRSAFVHANTGITELEYFGNGRFLLMGTNQLPHLLPCDYPTLRGGDSLKDGWSYVVPTDDILLNSEVSYAYADEEMDDCVREQTKALKALYLPRKVRTAIAARNQSSEVEHQTSGKEITFFVKRGLQVVGCVSYSERTGRLSDMALKPSARTSQVGKSLINAVRLHARKLGRSESLVVHTPTHIDTTFLETLGFKEIQQDGEDSLHVIV